MTEKLKEKIISTAYGTAGLTERLIVWLEVMKNPEALKALKEYKKTATAVHSLMPEKCPEESVRKITTKINSCRQKRKAFRMNLSGILNTRAFAFSIVSVLTIALAVTFYWQEKKRTEEVYSQEQVELAEQQTKVALAIVGKILNSSKTILKDEVIYKQVSRPISASIKTVNSLFNKGSKNETVN